MSAAGTIATTPEARRQGHALRLVAAVCDDLGGRGFAAIEAYPERLTRPDATSAVKLIQRIVDTPKVPASMPRCDHGETADRPSPVPSTSMISEIAAAVAAPAKIAAHETALACVESSAASVRTAGLRISVAAIVAMVFHPWECCSVRE